MEPRRNPSGAARAAGHPRVSNGKRSVPSTKRPNGRRATAAKAGNENAAQSCPLMRPMKKCQSSKRSRATCLLMSTLSRVTLTDTMVLHPVVRVHLIDASTGQYCKKSPEIPATTFNEAGTIDYILPIMTKPYSFQKFQSTAANWNETILIITEYLEVLSETAVAFFEILDFGTIGNIYENNDGWRRVAWAFMKLVGGNGQTNTEREQRLQLFQFPQPQLVTAAQQLILQHTNQQYPNETDAVPFVYQCWMSGKRLKYPSTLYVEVSGRPCPEARFVTHRPTNAIEIETGKLTYEQLMDKYLSKRTQLGEAVHNIATKPKWRRLPGQSCKIPKKFHFVIDTMHGSFSCAYSSSGLYLAVSCLSSNKEHYVKIYDALKGDRISTIEGHNNLIYEIKWAQEVEIFGTASSDGCVRVYKGQPDHTFELTASLHHPSFVYTVAFHPFFNKNHILASGCADGLLRIWIVAPPLDMHHHHHHHHYSQIRSSLTLYGHLGTINSVLFDSTGTRLYSADGAGALRIWACKGGILNSDTGKEAHFSTDCIKTVPMDTPIRSIALNSTDRKLLLTLANNTYHAYDTRIHRLMTRYTGMPASAAGGGAATPRATFSPCGSHIYAPGPDARTYVWKAETGALTHVYAPLAGGAARDVCFHPHDHYVAVCARSGVTVFTWEEGQDDAIDGRISVAVKGVGVAGLAQGFSGLALATGEGGDGAEIVAAGMSRRKISSVMVDPKVRALRDAADLVIQKMAANGIDSAAVAANRLAASPKKIRAYKGDGRMSVID
ncbi:WD40-repeat-containing domain protein [Chytriomyces sp. MP71]|nr:WD40-repeat-containing domain protein [Chytriomyces sp. MP71]